MAYPEVRVGGTGGVWLSQLGLLWGDLTVEHRWPFGCWETTWTIPTITAKKRPPALVANQPVDVVFAGKSIWSGQLTEPDWADGQFTAQGWVRQGETTPCLTSAGLTTTIPDTAIDQGITRGWLNWRRTASISSVAYSAADTGTGDATDDLNSISALLDAYTQDNKLRWGVDAQRRVYTAADPTTPAWDVSPDTDPLGVSSAALASTLVARYVADSAGTLATVIVGTGAPVVMVDLTGRGQITSAKATSICQNILAQTTATTGWTNGLTLTRTQITSGGIHPHLSMVVAGQMIRLLGQRDPRGLDANTSVVVGTSLWNVNDGTIELSPVDTADRDLSTIIANAGGELVS